MPRRRASRPAIRRRDPIPLASAQALAARAASMRVAPRHRVAHAARENGIPLPSPSPRIQPALTLDRSRRRPAPPAAKRLTLLRCPPRCLEPGTDIPFTEGGFRKTPAPFRRTGAGLARVLRDHEIGVLEVNRPDLAMRRSKGKPDPTDAENAARAVLAGKRTATPEERSGQADHLRDINNPKRAKHARARNRFWFRALQAPCPALCDAGAVSNRKRD